MSVFIFAACVCLHIVSGARPSREWRRVLDQHSLERNQAIQQSSPEASKQPLTVDCPELKDQLDRLGIRGEGNPCDWDGITCSSDCKVSSIVRRDVDGDLRAVKDFTGLQILDLRNSQVSGKLEALESLISLEKVDLSGTNVVGDLGPLQELKNLTVLNLSNTNVSGNFKLLQSFGELQILDLSQTRMYGELQKLQGLAELRRLNLEGTQVRGDLASIGHLTKLEHLVLDNTPVGGELSSLEQLTALQHLQLDKTKVCGDIGALQKMVDLQVVWLYNTKVYGNVVALESLTSLQKLDLGNTLAEGDLSFVQKLVALRELSLKNTNLRGDVANLKNLGSIQRLKIFGTKVVGDLESLQNLTSLQMLKTPSGVTGDLKSLRRLLDLDFLDIRDTHITGGLEQFQHLKRLKFLCLGNTEVHGDIVFLHNLTGLEVLWLWQTPVSGDTAVLQHFRDLQQISLRSSNVRGNIAALKHLIKLDMVLLADTKVGGHLEDFMHLAGIKYLNLKDTQVDGGLKALSSMTALQVLDLTNTGVNGDLVALRNCKSLLSLHIGKTKVHGDVSVVVELQALQIADFEGTDVSGWIEPSTWSGCCQNLQELSLADSRVGPLNHLQGIPAFSTQKPLLPALYILNVSGCALNGSVERLLLPLAGSLISTLLASGSALTGEVPDIGAMRAMVDGVYHSDWRSTLSRSLQTLDLSSNKLTLIDALPVRGRLDLSNIAPLTVLPAVVTKAARERVDLWLRDTQLNNPAELQPLLSHELRLGESYTRDRGSFACREVADPMLWVTPELFIPEQMCACNKGYRGSATACSPCPASTYSDEMNSPTCLPCPKGSTGPSTSASWANCRCFVGRIHQDDDRTLSCQCPPGEALVDEQVGSEHCMPCLDLKLLCKEAGTNASTALVQNGHARLQNGSHKVYQCLDAARCEPSDCAEGYSGRLCSDCSLRHHASGGECKPCSDLKYISAAKIASWVLCGAGALALIIAAAWFIRRKLADADLRLKCTVGLLVPQLFALLQLVQLWCVLARLEQPPSDFESANINDTANVTAMVEDSKGDAWASYLRVLQGTAEELQGVLVLQCIFDGAAARMFFAVATPLLPLALLLVCCFVELFTVGTGIQIGLKLLTVFFIGGASGAARLLECQRVDGTGKVSLEDFAFRRLMPHLLCTEATWVDLVGKSCAVCYGLLIPSFLAFLFAKQHLVMRQTKTFVAYYKGEGQKVTLKLQMVRETVPFEEDAKRKRLIAAATVFVALHVKGHAVVTLAKDGEAVIVDQVQSDQAAERASVDLGSDLPVDLFVPQPQEAAILRSHGEVMRHNAMVQMLTERSILADIQLKRSDRIMLGAKQLLSKYGSCQFVWMEVCVKVASAALVSVVDSKDGLWLSIAINVGMALVVGITQPFARPQENAVHTLCFACLAIAAVGFRELYTWLTRLALLLPVLLLVVTLARPDSQEALAMRLHEELEAKLPDGPVKVSTERLQFL